MVIGAKARTIDNLNTARVFGMIKLKQKQKCSNFGYKGGCCFPFRFPLCEDIHARQRKDKHRRDHVTKQVQGKCDT